MLIVIIALISLVGSITNVINHGCCHCSAAAVASTQRANKEFSRFQIVEKALKFANGVYRDQQEKHKHGLENTILVNVVAPSSTQSKYAQLLKNSQCFADAHSYRSVTYIIPEASHSFGHDISNFKSNHARKIESNLQYLTYPLGLFRSILALKRTHKHIGGDYARVDYEGNVPSFSHHGALVMLVPILEVLQHGYNVIYFDLDVALLRDPIPHLMHGNADFTVSVELRNCDFPSMQEQPLQYRWDRLEPNTGILHLRSSPALIDFYITWLQRIVNENLENDQKVLKFTELGAQQSFSCNPALAHLDNEPHRTENKLNRSSISTVPFLLRGFDFMLKPLPKHQPISFCFLDEFLFQNGKMVFDCATGQRGGSAPDYLLAMYQRGCRVRDQHSNVSLIVPVAVHVNYCDDKIDRLQAMGLWLVRDEQEQAHESANNSIFYNPSNRAISNFNGNVSFSGGSMAPSASKFAMHHQCRPYSHGADTSFGSVDWPQQIATAQAELDAVRRLVVNGSVVKMAKDSTVYLVIDGSLRPIPDGDTFEEMGFSWQQIVQLHNYAFAKRLPVGPFLPSVRASLSAPHEAAAAATASSGAGVGRSNIVLWLITCLVDLAAHFRAFSN